MDRILIIIGATVALISLWRIAFAVESIEKILKRMENKDIH